MLAILGVVSGIVSAVFPEVLKFWKDKKDKEHEIKLLQLQMEYAKLGHAQRLEEIEFKADLETEKLALQKPQIQPLLQLSGNKWIDAILIGLNNLVLIANGFVRPFLAYFMLAGYTAFKYAMYLSMIKNNFTSVDAIIKLWTPFDEALLFGVISHFVSFRALKYYLKR